MFRQGINKKNLPKGKFLLSIAPVMAPLFGWIFLREKVSPRMLMGILVSTIGVAVLVLVGTESFAIGNPWGILLAVVAVMFALSGNVMLRRILERYNPLTVIFYTQVVSFVLFCGLWAFTDMRSETVRTIAQGIAAEWQSLAYLAVMSSAVAFMLYCYGVRIVGVVKANVFNSGQLICKINLHISKKKCNFAADCSVGKFR